jgi:hypothetical protein
MKPSVSKTPKKNNFIPKGLKKILAAKSPNEYRIQGIIASYRSKAIFGHIKRRNTEITSYKKLRKYLCKICNIKDIIINNLINKFDSVYIEKNNLPLVEELCIDSYSDVSDDYEEEDNTIEDPDFDPDFESEAESEEIEYFSSEEESEWEFDSDDSD